MRKAKNKRNLRKDLGRKRMQGPVMVTFHIQGLMDMVVLSSDKGFLVKVPPMLRLLNSTKIGCLTLSLREEMVVDIHCLFVLDVKESMRLYV
ncbi:hypothetical protein MTR67_026892 [Solanum verrucosum]|uniref:Uncharacterized protein n=1 Tax=Solanum verrucosum TaxID=315347 RepID=A0AAF0QZT7_SOLVR|nr:hypothetical protein MTR67_026892 [Solanum verrucosum]